MGYFGALAQLLCNALDITNELGCDRISVFIVIIVNSHLIISFILYIFCIISYITLLTLICLTGNGSHTPTSRHTILLTRITACTVAHKLLYKRQAFSVGKEISTLTESISELAECVNL